MKFLEKIINKSSTLQYLIGLTLKQLEQLEKELLPCWEESESKRKNRYSRRRSIGAGHPYKAKTLKEKIVIVLI